jgi:uncharacterized caspase-like protein
LAAAVLGLLQAGFAQAQEPPTKYWAVICGVANYKMINDLNYTDDDARDFAAALEQYAVWQGPNQIEVLIDSAASKNGIRDAILRMGSKAQPADHNVFLFFFSGHGMQVVDSSGDESDGIDEAICAWDTQIKGRTVSNVITDDEIGAWLAALPSDGEVVAIFDTCFSGGMADEAKGLTVKSVRNPNLPPQAKVRRHFGNGLARRLAARGAEAADSGAKDVGGTNAVVLMACEEGGLSYETSSLQNGIFSYYLVEGLGGPATGAPADDEGDGVLSAEEEFAYASLWTLQYVSVTQVPVLYDGEPDRETVIVQPGESPPPEPTDVVTITKAEYKLAKHELTVQATSSVPGGVAVLTVIDYGEMTYNKRNDAYTFQARPVDDPGETVTVTSSLGGFATVLVKHR